MPVDVSSMSADEYLATSESRPQHTELISGTVIVNEPRLAHSRIQTELIYQLRRWIDEHEGRGYVSTPTDVVVDDRNVFAPDVWWVGEDRRPPAGALHLDGLPDLVIEIRSPSTWARDLAVKLPAYEAGGVSEAWFVDTEARTVLIFRRSTVVVPTFDLRTEVGGDEQLTTPLLDGFALRVGSIFEA